ncbi:hypothetical protein OROGR_017736 [Orobanche gracilis]
MFKLQRPTHTNTNRPSKPRSERFEFKFSDFQALQVPKGCDRLCVSLIHVETGKTMAKLGKALVRNGSCQWTETLSEFIYLVLRDDSSKGYEDCFVKLIISTGSTRSSILGEVTVNMAHFTRSRVTSAVSQPLKKSSYGTILQIPKISDGQRHPLRLWIFFGSRMESSAFLALLILNVVSEFSNWRLYATGNVPESILKIQCRTPRPKTRDEESKSTNSQENDQNVHYHDPDTSSYKSDNSSDSTPREDPATTSCPLKLDIKETSQSASYTTQSFDCMEGSIGKENLSKKNALKNEDCDFLGNQVAGSYSTIPIPNHHSVDIISPPNHSSSKIINKRSSTMNIGSSKHLLEAAEDTINELRAEAKMWERNARKLMIDLDISRQELTDQSIKHSELLLELSAEHAEKDGLKREVENLKIELKNKCTQDPVVQSENLVQIQKVLENEMKYQQDLNVSIGQQLKRSQESNIELVSVLQELEQTIEQQRIEIENLSSLKIGYTDLEKKLEEALRDKTDKLENEQKSNGKILLQVKKDYEYKIAAKEEEIASLEATLSAYVKGEHSENNMYLTREIGSLREKIQELEKDCSELTHENLDLLLKLKDLNKITDIKKCTTIDESEMSDPKLGRERNDLENSLLGLQEEKVQLRERVSGLECKIRQLKDDKKFYVQETDHFKSVATTLQDEVQKLIAEMDIQTFVLRRNFTDLHKQLLGAQEECEYLKEGNIKLQNVQASLQEVESKAEVIENKLNAAIQESEIKVQDLTGQLAVAEQNHKKLMADNEKVLKLLANCKRSEENLNTDLNDLKSKHTISNYERHQLSKENGILKGQLQKMLSLQDEISSLKSELKACEVDKVKLEVSLETVSSNYEILKAENTSLSGKISILQSNFFDYDECKRNKTVVEEKLLQIENAKEIIRMEKDTQSLEKELKKEGARDHDFHDQSPLFVGMDYEKNRVPQESRNSSGQKNGSVSWKKPSVNDQVVPRERHERTKSSLETELRELKERYLEMSLKYAEVETEREDLVMKLKSAASNGGKRWFS